jgi:predicted nucleic acid-binding protein
MFVVDASIALTWCIDAEATEANDAVLHRLLLEGGIAPAHWPLEMANAVRFAANRGRLDDRDVDRARSIILDLPVDVLPVETSTALGLVGVAQSFDLSVYDAAYLELAWVRGLGLATVDSSLRRASNGRGVALIQA